MEQTVEESRENVSSPVLPYFPSSSPGNSTSYLSSVPSMVGFFSISNPLSAAIEMGTNIPLENSALTRAATLGAAFMGLQHYVGKLRSAIYKSTGISGASENVKRVADCAYGALCGSVLTPAMHAVTKYAFELPQTASIQDAAFAGATVGGLTGMISWFTADMAADTWSTAKNHNRQGPGTSYLRSLSNKSQKKILAAAAIASTIATLGIYAYRNHTEPHIPEHFHPSYLEEAVLASR